MRVAQPLAILFALRMVLFPGPPGGIFTMPFSLVAFTAAQLRSSSCIPDLMCNG